jgi:murein DD-endopeptidase MepM/ murein hydrolase activator NlpD
VRKLTRRNGIIISLACWLALAVGVLGAEPAAAAGDWSWPVLGPVVRLFDPPGTPYGSGHRGIDIAAPVGTLVRAPAPGTVSFAGKVGGHLFVTIQHAGNLASTYSWLSAVLVHKGDAVLEGQAVARSGTGAASDPAPNLHLGVKLAGAYVDPLDYLSPLDLGDLIRLAPLT